MFSSHVNTIIRFSIIYHKLVTVRQNYNNPIFFVDFYLAVNDEKN